MSLQVLMNEMLSGSRLDAGIRAGAVPQCSHMAGRCTLENWELSARYAVPSSTDLKIS